MDTIRSANRHVVAALDRSSSGLVLAMSFVVGAAWGGFARVWMRYITTHEDFSWPGTLFIIAGFGVAFAGQASVYLARRGASRSAFIGLRVLALLTLLPLSFGAGSFGFPVIVLGPLVVVRSGWNRWFRVLLGVVVLLFAVGVSASFFADLSLMRAVIGSAWFAGVYAVLVWAVCFSFAAQNDERFTLAIRHPGVEEAAAASRP